MTKIGIFGDVHLTKRMGAFQQQWNDSAIKTFEYMYQKFEEECVDYVVCLGDFFDKSVLEARSVSLVTSILKIINSCKFSTKFLLGNHEIDSDEHNILEFLHEYENIDPITQLRVTTDSVYVPYLFDIEQIAQMNPDWCKGKYVFTHHDIYGSLLASGKVKASFGVNPSLFELSRKTFNGHVHTPSTLGKVQNVGSILKSQQGEMAYDNRPEFYILDLETGLQSSYKNPYSLLYMSVPYEQLSLLPLTEEEKSRTVLRVDCKSSEDVGEVPDGFLHVVMKLSAKHQTLETTDTLQNTNVDLKEFIARYIQKDETILPEQKSVMINLGIQLLEGGSV